MKGQAPQTARTRQNVAKHATWLDLTKTLNSSALLNAAARGDGDDGEAAEVARHDVGLSEQCKGPDAE